MSHYVSIWSSLLLQSYHHLPWLNSYLWQMQIPLMIDCYPKFPPVLCTACVLSNTPREPSQASLTQSCILKTGLTPFPIGHAMLSSPYLTAWRQTGAEEAAEETLILNLSPCHYRPVWPPIRGPWVMWETLGPVLPTPVGQAACSVQTKLKTTGQTQLGLTSMRRRALYAHSVVRRREAWILISLSLVFTRMLSSSFPFSPRKPYFWALHPIKAKSNGGRDCSFW